MTLAIDISYSITMTYSTGTGSGVDYVSGSILHVDTVYLLSQYNITVDMGYIAGNNGTISATGIPTDQIMTNFITTYTSFTIKKPNPVSFTLLSNGTISLLQGTYSFLNASFINIRK